GEEVEQSIAHADLIITYVRHPDVVLEICESEKPVILAINFGEGFYQQAKEINPKAVMPQTMCKLEPNTDIREINEYAEQFGSPKLKIEINRKPRIPLIGDIKIITESPCGAIRNSLKFLEGKPITPKVINSFGLNVSQECREPMSVLLRRSHMGESAASTARLIVLEELKKEIPQLFQSGSELDKFYKSCLKEASDSEPGTIFRHCKKSFH
ncbi:MAG: hypothetical protein GF364_19770, partial [Candidatus Lokiarchaeota archaeon]|nr:hypothetical protein [Candidatus Lokiarchaeota archaeon]